MTRKKPAFTLLELLTVIGILTLLIGILVPSLSAARRQAKANACLSALSGLGKSFVVYLNENDGRQILHVAFGSVLTDATLGPALNELLAAEPETHRGVLREHFGKHLTALRRGM